MFPSFKRGNLVEMVFNSLKENILSGELKNNELLPTQDILARQFGVSRTVMREALNKLSSLGLIESQQGRGTFVRIPDAEKMMGPIFTALLMDESSTRDLMEARYYLERIIVRLAARHADSEQLLGLKAIVERMEQDFQNGNLESFSEDDLAFHMHLAAMSKNSVLKRIVETIREMLFKFLEDFNRLPGTAERAIGYHRRIYHAVSEQDPDKAEREMQEHLWDVMNALHTERTVTVEE